MAPTLVQESPVASSGALATTLTATLPGAATAGNIIWWACAGDKDIGTLTLSGFSAEVNLRSTQVSLVLAWKVAAGGETAISGTITGANTSGSDVWAGEYSEAGAGAWELKATSGTNNSDGTTALLVCSTGTTGTTTSAGRALAGWSVDSVNTEGTATYSGGYTEQANPSAAAIGVAGLWLAELNVAASATTECTLTRAGGATSDQMSGGVVVFGRTPAVGGDTAAMTRGFFSLL